MFGGLSRLRSIKWGAGSIISDAGWVWALTLVVMTCLLLVPFALVDVPPVLDYPNHLARFFVLAHPDDPVLSQIYTPHWRLVPNLGFDALAVGVLKIFDVHVGGRILLAISLLAPMFGVIVYARTMFGEWTWWSLASGLTAYNAIFQLGFMNFLLSLGLAFASAAAWIALRRRERNAAAAVVGASLTSLIFFTHIFGVLLFAVLIAADELSKLMAQWRERRLTRVTVLTAAARLAITCLPAVMLFLASPLSADTTPLGEWSGREKIWALFGPFASTHLVLTMVTAAVFFLLIAEVRRQALFVPGFFIALAMLALILFVVPRTIKEGTFVDVRFGLMIGLLLFAGMRPRLARSVAVVATVVIAALFLAKSAWIGLTWFDHQQDLADVRRAIASVEPATRVLVARGRPGFDVTSSRPQRALPGYYRLDGHVAALLLIEQRAFWPFLFASSTQQPVEIKPSYQALSNRLGEPIDASWLKLDDSTVPGYLKHWRTNFDRLLLIDPVDGLPPADGLIPIVTTAYAGLYKIGAVK